MLKSYRHSRYHFYHSSIKSHLSSSILVLAIIFGVLFIVFHYLTPINFSEYKQISLVDILVAASLTLFRLLIAYILSLIIAVPLVLISTSYPKIEKFLLPIFDIFQSIPALAFFPVLVLLFIKYNLYELASIFILFMAMVWNLVFSMIAGLKTIPSDIKDVAIIYKAKGLKKLIFISLPAIFPYIITGSLLAWGSSWTIVIVAEVLHTYIPNGNISQDLFGLGSLLVNSAYLGNNFLFTVTLLMMVLMISLINFFIWQKLLKASERYKFD